MSALCYARLIAPALPFIAAAPALAQTCAPYWSNIGSGLSSSPYRDSLILHQDGAGSRLFASVWQGQHRQAVRWDGSTWVNISAGLPTSLESRWISLFHLDFGVGPQVFAFVSLRTNPPQYFGRVWANGNWAPTPPGFVRADATSAWILGSFDLGMGPRVYCLLQDTPSSFSHRVAVWTGVEWALISDALDPYSAKLVVYDDGGGPRLYMLGGFSWIGNMHVQGFARWMGGTTWERPPSNHFALDTMYDAFVFDDGGGPAIFAHGTILTEPENYFPGVGRYRNGIWENLGGPAGCSNCVYTRGRLAVFDDGSGPALYVTGGFNNWGGVEARGIVKWNGKHWSPVIRGVFAGSEVTSMAAGIGPHGNALYVGGGITQAGAGTVHYVAEYKGCPNCYANCDHSTIAPALNVRDFMCFLNKFAEDDPYANCDGSTDLPGLTVADFACYLNKFAAGCP